jgi:hypothetical protein
MKIYPKIYLKILDMIVIAHVIPKPVWAIGFALEQTLHVVTLPVFLK